MNIKYWKCFQLLVFHFAICGNSIVQDNDKIYGIDTFTDTIVHNLLLHFARKARVYVYFC